MYILKINCKWLFLNPPNVKFKYYFVTLIKKSHIIGDTQLRIV